MSKSEFTMGAVGPYASNGNLDDVDPSSEVKVDRDENDLAIFGKRPQLKVHDADDACCEGSWY